MSDAETAAPLRPKPVHPPAQRPIPNPGSRELLEELQRQYQRAKLFAEVTLKIRQSLDLAAILQTTVTEVQRILKADRVLIYQVLPDGTGKSISEAVLPEYTSILGMNFPEEVFPSEYQQLYAAGRVQAIADVYAPQSGLAECLVEFVEKFEIQAKLIVPIVHSFSPEKSSPEKSRGAGQNNNDAKIPAENQLWGLLIAHQCNGPRQWDEFELDLMQQLANQISIAIAQGELLANLETIVTLRTAELQQSNRQLQQEICDRIQAEAARRRNEEQLRLITNALPVLIAYIDTKQHYQFNNQAYADWLNQDLAKITGKHLQSIWGKDSYRRMQPWVKKALAGETVTYENEIRLANGQARSVAVTYIPHYVSPANSSQRPKVQGFFALTTDISERKAIERLKDEFISVVSHELRTPLTSIHSALKILATGRLGTLSQDGKQMLAIADENTDRWCDW